MRIGAHVRAGGQIVKALERGADIGADVVQIFTQSPRAWKPSQYAPEVLEEYRDAQKAHPSITETFCHATYLINLATSDPELLSRSIACLDSNLDIASQLGASGLVLHVGSHKGSGFAECTSQVVSTIANALESNTCPILLENAAGAGGTVGRSFEELSILIEGVKTVIPKAPIGVCIDTQHLWASGIGFGSVEEANEVWDAFDRLIGFEYLGCLHLNDSKVPFGANRDRHANIGEGSIGTAALGAFLSHPRLAGLAAILEVPGAGDGPRTEDVSAARKCLAVGKSTRAKAQ